MMTKEPRLLRLPSRIKIADGGANVEALKDNGAVLLHMITRKIFISNLIISVSGDNFS